MGTRVWRQPGGDPSTSGNVNFEANAAAAPTSSLTGNPYIDNWGTPDPADDEFDDGSDNLLERGWTVYDFNTCAALSYGGPITSFAAPVEPTQFRSKRYGSNMVVQVMGGQHIAVVRSVPTVTDKQYTMRIGIPWARPVSSGNNSETVMSGAVQVSIIRSSNASGCPLVGNNWHRMLFGERGGGNAYAGYEQFGYGKLMEPTDQYTPAIYHGVSGIWAKDAGGALNCLSLIDTEAGSVRMSYRQENGGEMVFAAKQVGFTLYQDAGLSSSSPAIGGPAACFMVDYFRQRTGFDWYGLST